jgi:hypothetical protein
MRWWLSILWWKNSWFDTYYLVDEDGQMLAYLIYYEDAYRLLLSDGQDYREICQYKLARSEVSTAQHLVWNVFK